MEALNYGNLCVSSNTGALSQIGDGLVMRLDPQDTLAWSRTIALLMSCPSECDACEERIRRHYVQTTWDNAAQSFFNALLGGADPEFFASDESDMIHYQALDSSALMVRANGLMRCNLRDRALSKTR